jgi:predicted nuclease of predicted toxin-antitoxin system
MEEIKNEDLVTEEVVETEVTENVEQTTEETPKTYSQEEFEAALNERLNKRLDEILPGKIARREAKIRKEYDKKYGDLENVLRAGTGKENVEDMTATFKDFYQKKGIQIQEKPNYSDRDIEVLAKAEAQDIISYGFDEVVEEVDRLAQIGAGNMDKREKALFKALAEYRQSVERTNELSKMGVTEDVYKSKEFADFASKFNPTVSVSEIYEIYKGKQPKKDIKPMGSMKQAQSEQRDYFTPEEIERLTMEDLDDPVIWEKARRSMTGR